MKTPALNICGLHKRFGKTEILRGITLEIPAGERWAIIGPNGAGKSMLLNVLSGFANASAGEIYLYEKKIDHLPSHAISHLGLSRSFQLSNTFPKLTAYENLQCAALWAAGYGYCFWRRIKKLDDITQRVDQVLHQIGLSHHRETPAGLLGYAEQRALEIGITIAGNAHTILLDEPTAGMSSAEAEAMVALLRSFTIGKTLLMVEHDMQVVFELADKIAVMVQGEIIACDTPAGIRANPAVQEAYLGHDFFSITRHAA